jgi:hypothetical protein
MHLSPGCVPVQPGIDDGLGDGDGVATVLVPGHHSPQPFAALGAHVPVQHPPSQGTVGKPGAPLQRAPGAVHAAAHDAASAASAARSSRATRIVVAAGVG